MKVKLFSEETLPKKFDEQINEFMSDSRVNVVDIKFTATEICGQIRLYALVLYEDEKKK